MSVRARKCKYYKKSKTSYESCCINDKLSPCKLLLGQNCKNFFLYTNYLKALELKNRQTEDVEELRKFLWAYKNKYKLSNLHLQLDIEVAQSTIYNFLNNIKVSVTTLKKIRKFVNKIRGKNV